MQIMVRSAFDDKTLETEIQNAVEFAEQNNYYLADVKFSTCYVAEEGGVLRSALLMFEEYDEEDSKYKW